ncbi:hypothetical protein [Bacillus sonorensis]|uniref:hypothetical protein n=1 Tax=Bacillus sonorensis TaxID=119858 RepID=UPI0022805D0F|nr:hypothetical protein [Bacillus sonorensis]MCY8404366.1 hypothetical protein [Bacillus sonorensis]
MKGKFIKLLLVLAVAIGSFASLGFIGSDTAQAKDRTIKSTSSVSVFREGKLHYKKATYSNTFGYSWAGHPFTTLDTYRSGKVKATLQYKTKKGWKNYKTFYVNKKGHTIFKVSSYLDLYTKFRYKFENIGSKKPIPYKFYSHTTLKFSRAEAIAFANSNPAKTTEQIRKNKYGVNVARKGSLFYKKPTYTNTFGYSYAYKLNGVITGFCGTSIDTDRSGKVKATLQYKTKKGWKNYKTLYVTKKGYTYLKVDVRNLGFHTTYRYKFENVGSKKPIPYRFYSSTPYKYIK